MPSLSTGNCWCREKFKHHSATAENMDVFGKTVAVSVVLQGS
jgi:hypothetical protein